jgi:hypothetical protein
MVELFRRHYTHSISVARGILPAQEVPGCRSVGLSFCVPELPVIPRRGKLQNVITELS